MKINNKHNLPLPLYAWLSQNMYDLKPKEKVISATGLLRPIQENLLTTRNSDKIEIDCIDNIWSLFGSGIHVVLEQIDWSKYVKFYQAEERLEAETLGWKISGKFDLILDNQLNDYKVTSGWTRVFGSRETEWTEQLSIYRWLYKQVYNKELDAKGKINALYRDWDKRNVREGSNYPVIPFESIELELMSFIDTETMIKLKIIEIEKAILLEDDKLPECSKKERWWNEKKQVFNKCEKYCKAYPFCKQIAREKIKEIDNGQAIRTDDKRGNRPGVDKERKRVKNIRKSK